MNNNYIEKHIIDLIKNASFSSISSYRNLDFLNEISIDAGIISNYIVDASSFASQAKQELQNLIELHNDELIRLIKTMNKLNIDLSKILEQKFENLTLLEEKNLTDFIRENDQYVGAGCYKNKGVQKVTPFRNELDVKNSNTLINATNIQIKKVDSSTFKNTFKELNKVTSFSNNSYKYSNRSRNSEDKNQVSLDMSRANENSKSASRHADFALASFKLENQVLNDNIVKCNNIIKILKKEIKYQAKSIARIDDIIKYTECKVDILNKEINSKKLESSKTFETEGTPLIIKK